MGKCAYVRVYVEDKRVRAYGCSSYQEGGWGVVCEIRVCEVVCSVHVKMYVWET